MYLFTLSLLASIAWHQSIGTTSSLCAAGDPRILSNSKGQLHLVVYMPLQCSHCHRQLRELTLMVESIDDLRVSIFAPSFEDSTLVQRMQQEFARLSIQKDNQGIFPSNGARLHDQYLYDRCGRLSTIMNHPRSDVTSYRDTLSAIEEALLSAKCGYCQYDGRGSRDLNNRHSQKRLDAYLKALTTRPPQRNQPEAGSQQNRANYNYPQQPSTSYNSYQQSRNTPNYNNHQPERREEYQSTQQNSHQSGSYRDTYRNLNTAYEQQRSQDRYRQDFQSRTQNYQQDQRQYRPEPTQDYGSQRRDYGITEQRRNSVDQARSYSDRRMETPNGNGRSYENRNLGNMIVTTTTTESPLSNRYAPDDDYDDYDEEETAESASTIATTLAPETQIPPPPYWNPAWPTPHPSLTNRRDIPGGHHSLPCSAFTTDICYHQLENLGPENISKCCSQGVYLTDLCIPGKCSNTTTQLCCMQKFLQAKYLCCEDPEMSNGTSATHDFSKCCYRNFFEEDECCPQSAAAQYWNSVSDICLPNTKVDLSKVKMEVRFAEGVRVINLGEKRLWDHQCRYGGNRIQLAYVP